MKLHIYVFSLAIVFCTSCTKEQPVDKYYLNNIEGTVTVKDYWTGNPVGGARVDCKINGTSYAYDANFNGVASIIYPIINQPGNPSGFPKLVDLTINHFNFQTEYFDQPINYNKVLTDINGNVTTHYYQGYFTQTIWLKPD